MVCASQQSSNTSYCSRKYNECMEGKEHSGLNSGGWGYSECRRCHEYCLAQGGIWDCPRPH